MPGRFGVLEEENDVEEGESSLSKREVYLDNELIKAEDVELKTTNIP